MSNSGMVERRSMLKAAAALGGLSTLAIIALAVSEAAQECESRTTSVPGARLEDVSAGPNAKLTIERRGQVVLLGVNRPYIQNRIDPETHRWASCVMVFGRPTNCPPWSRRGHLLWFSEVGLSPGILFQRTRGNTGRWTLARVFHR
jgi:hypothetical protein